MTAKLQIRTFKITLNPPTLATFFVALLLGIVYFAGGVQTAAAQTCTEWGTWEDGVNEPTCGTVAEPTGACEFHTYTSYSVTCHDCGYPGAGGGSWDMEEITQHRVCLSYEPPPPPPTNGSCGATTNSCSAGSLSDTADTSTQYRWSCTGSNGGTTASCSKPKPGFIISSSDGRTTIFVG